VCVTMKGVEGEAARMRRLVTALAPLGVPLAIDSADPEVLLAGVEHVRGPAILNSITVTTPRMLLARIFEAARARRVMVVGMCIDAGGMARTAAHKLAAARALVALAGEHGLAPEALLIDPLTFPGAGAETVEGVVAITDTLGARTVVGISDVSYGMPPAERPAVNAAFYRDCSNAGVTAAIVNPAHLK
jgi:5-methyltetrahydrofolate--homocysteine methyltransferase